MTITASKSVVPKNAKSKSKIKATSKMTTIIFIYNSRMHLLAKPSSVTVAKQAVKVLFKLNDHIDQDKIVLSQKVNKKFKEVGNDETAWLAVKHRAIIEVCLEIPVVSVATKATQADIVLPRNLHSGIATQRPKMQIIVKTPTNKVVQFHLEKGDNTTVLEVKELIMNRQGMPIDQQRLVFAGKQLEDARMLSEYDIKSDSVLYVVLRLRGSKPVVLFDYPKGTVESATVSVTLDPVWKFSALYPVVPSFKSSVARQTATWHVKIEGDRVSETHRPYTTLSSLFWEAATVGPAPVPGVADHGKTLPFDPRNPEVTWVNSLLFEDYEIVYYLEGILRSLMLSDTSATEFIQYWIPTFTHLFQNGQSIAIRFVPKKHLDKIAALRIEPAPDVIFRIFMVFKGVNKEDAAKWKNADENDMTAIWLNDRPTGHYRPNQKKVIEWGGMQCF